MTLSESLKILKRRADWLTKRIEEAKADGRELAWDRSERAALQVVIEILSEDLVEDSGR